MCMSGGGAPQEIVMEKLPDAPGSPAELLAIQSTAFNGSSPDEIASANIGLDESIAAKQLAIQANTLEISKINARLSSGKFNRATFLATHPGVKAKVDMGKKVNLRAIHAREVASGKVKITTKKQANQLKITRNTLTAGINSAAVEAQQLQASKATNVAINQLGAADNTVAARGRDSLRIDRGTP